MSAGLRITEADEAERAACCAFAPEAADPRVALLVARQDGDFAGVAAIQWECRMSPAGFGLQVRVLAPLRRRGIGRALVAAAKAHCRGETQGLWSARSHRLETPAAAFLGACGFQAARGHHHFRIALADFQAQIRPALDRARRRDGGRTPLRIVTLADAPLREVAWLVTAEFGAAPGGLLNLLELAQARDGLSQVALAEDGVAGALLGVARQSPALGKVVHVDAWVIAPAHRRGMASLALFDAAVDAARAAGIGAITFDCEAAVRDTVRLARRAGAEDAPGAAFYAAI